MYVYFKRVLISYVCVHLYVLENVLLSTYIDTEHINISISRIPRLAKAKGSSRFD